jgi:hypothetical protein
MNALVGAGAGKWTVVAPPAWSERSAPLMMVKGTALEIAKSDQCQVSIPVPGSCLSGLYEWWAIWTTPRVKGNGEMLVSVHQTL